MSSGNIFWSAGTFEDLTPEAKAETAKIYRDRKKAKKAVDKVIRDNPPPMFIPGQPHNPV